MSIRKLMSLAVAGGRWRSLALAGLLALPLVGGNLDPAYGQAAQQELSTRSVVIKNCVDQEDYLPLTVNEGIWNKTTAGICNQKNSKNKRAAAKFRPKEGREKVAVTSWGSMKHAGLFHNNQLGKPSCIGSTRYESGKTKIYCTFR